MNIWRFTGNPENWITALQKQAWALNENNKSLWENHIEPGDVVLFHSTKKSDFTKNAESAVIGFGYIGSKLYKKDELWWIQEIESNELIWPYVVPFESMYFYSNISNIDLDRAIDHKSAEQITAEIEMLLENAVSISELNRLAKLEDTNVPNFPVNGSASKVNPFYEALFLEKSKFLFGAAANNSDEKLESRIAENMDSSLSKRDFDKVLEEALTFNDPGGESHKFSEKSQKIRIENQLQKRKIARIENYTCQVCGFRCEYINSKGQKAWIIDVDHINEKSNGGTEEAKNLWVLCPNCHRKKTAGIIRVDVKMKTVFEKDQEIKLKSDHHLFVSSKK